VPQIDKRLTEAAKGLPPIAGMEVVAVEKVDEALDKLI